MTAAVANNDEQVGNFRFRHYGNRVCNALFVDGHAGSFTYYAAQKTSDIKRLTSTLTADHSCLPIRRTFKLKRMLPAVVPLSAASF